MYHVPYRGFWRSASANSTSRAPILWTKSTSLQFSLIKLTLSHILLGFWGLNTEALTADAEKRKGLSCLQIGCMIGLEEFAGVTLHCVSQIG